jgi:hypothetical protein
VNGSLTVAGAADVRVGDTAGGSGTLHQTGGSVLASDWTYIGRSGTGTYLMDGGNFSTDDNFSIALNAGSSGTMTQTAGAVTVEGNQPSPAASGFGTGNVIVSRSGTGTLSVSGGSIDMEVNTVTAENTFNSATASFALATGLGTELNHAKDGNLYIAERAGTGIVNLSGTGVINAGANVFVGGADFSDIFNILPGNGTLNITGGELHVGVTSPTGGDVVIGAVSGTVGTVNLKGGLLDVGHGTGVIAAAELATAGGSGAKTFNFTGGTLKVKEWNVTSAGGNLGNLVQNSNDSASLLDVTTNSTVLHSSYDLGAGTATVGNGQSLTIDQGMINSAGLGIVNVNTGGLMTSNNLRTDTANIGGTVTVRANGGTGGGSLVETLSITSGGKLNLKDNDLVVGTGSVLDVRSQIKLGLSGASNTAAAVGITSDTMTLGVHGFGYAAGNDPRLSPLLTGPDELTGQAFDTDSVLVKFTYRGDADLDGDSDLDDLGHWANAFTGDLGLGPVAAPTTLWTQGDWDYDGDTDLDDLGFWSSNFTGDLGGGGLSVYAPNASEGAISALAGMGITAVPEPGSALLLVAGLGAIGLRTLRRRNARTA